MSPFDTSGHSGEPGREATSLVLGIVPMLIVAGTIEAFVSPTGLAIPLKFGMSGALLVLLNVYLFGAGKESEPQSDARMQPTA